MTEKNIFAYKLFLSSNISDFNYFFFVELAAPPKKSHLLFPSNLPLKVEVLSSPPFLKIWLEVQPPLPPPQQKGEGLHTIVPYGLWAKPRNLDNYLKVFKV